MSDSLIGHGVSLDLWFAGAMMTAAMTFVATIVLLSMSR
jgi:hypothetical protein